MIRIHNPITRRFRLEVIRYFGNAAGVERVWEKSCRSFTRALTRANAYIERNRHSLDVAELSVYDGSRWVSLAYWQIIDQHNDVFVQIQYTHVALSGDY